MMELNRDFVQIVRIDGKEVFVEVVNSGFEIGKVILRFIKYNEKAAAKSKFVHDISIYLNLDKFLVLANDVLSNKLPKEGLIALATAKKADYKFAKHIYLHQGGVGKAKLAKQNKTRPDGMALARHFKITPSFNEKFPWVLSAEIGPGEEQGNGIIAAKYGNRPEEIVRVAMSSEDLKKMMLIVKSHIDGFIASQYYVSAMTPRPVKQSN